jgi:hypothetical protein
MESQTGELNELEFDDTDGDSDVDDGGVMSPRRVYADQGDPEVESLYGKYKRGKLVVRPEFQRQFVWDALKSSRLIESALLEIPLPVIYLSEEKDGREFVIDGQQRLTAFFSFLDGKFPDGDKEFRLTGNKVFRELDRKTFKDLSEDLQDTIRYCKIRTITFRKESDHNLKYEVFERLNTGAVSLNEQELRNCVYRGSYNGLLKELARDGDLTYLLGLKAPDNRMKDIELVLRFAAFYHSTYLKYKPPMKNFLNNEMQEHQNILTEKADNLRHAFKNAVAIIRSLLDTHAFKRFYSGTEKKPDGYWEPKKFNTSLYDVLMYSFATVDKNRVYQSLDAIRESLIHLMTNDQEFVDAIELSTSSVQSVTKRFDKFRHTLEAIIGIAQKEPRCFTYKLKQELYDFDPTCAICGQKIQNIDDSAVDHVDQYWTGGKTIPENARLTHRYCNWARSRKE